MHCANTERRDNISDLRQIREMLCYKEKFKITTFIQQDKNQSLTRHYNNNNVTFTVIIIDFSWYIVQLHFKSVVMS